MARKTLSEGMSELVRELPQIFRRNGEIRSNKRIYPKDFEMIMTKLTPLMDKLSKNEGVHQISIGGERVKFSLDVGLTERIVQEGQVVALQLRGWEVEYTGF